MTTHQGDPDLTREPPVLYPAVERERERAERSLWVRARSVLGPGNESMGPVSSSTIGRFNSSCWFTLVNVGYIKIIEV